MIRALTTTCWMLLALSAGGCVVPSYMARQDPGNAPRAGEVFEVTPVGSEQVQFVFRFKAGPDPKPALPKRPDPAPSKIDEQGNPIPQPELPQPRPLTPTVGAASVKIVEARITDTRGRSLGVIDQTVRREANTFYVVVTTAAAAMDTYEVVCQVHLAADQYQVKIASAASREVDRWRADPKSFKFAVYGDTESRPWWEFNLLSPK